MRVQEKSRIQIWRRNKDKKKDSFRKVNITIQIIKVQFLNYFR